MADSWHFNTIKRNFLNHISIFNLWECEISGEESRPSYHHPLTLVGRARGHQQERAEILPSCGHLGHNSCWFSKFQNLEWGRANCHKLPVLESLFFTTMQGKLGYFLPSALVNIQHLFWQKKFHCTLSKNVFFPWEARSSIHAKWNFAASKCKVSSFSEKHEIFRFLWILGNKTRSLNLAYVFLHLFALCLHIQFKCF